MTLSWMEKKRRKLRGEVSGGHNNHWPCHKSLGRQQRSHSTVRLAAFVSPFVQLTDTIVLQYPAVFAQGKLAFSDRLRWEDEWRGAKGAKKEPRGGMLRKDESFLRRCGTKELSAKRRSCLPSLDTVYTLNSLCS